VRSDALLQNEIVAREFMPGAVMRGKGKLILR